MQRAAARYEVNFTEWKNKKAKNRPHRESTSDVRINERDGRWITAALSAIIMLMWFLTTTLDYQPKKEVNGKVGEKTLIGTEVESKRANTAGCISSCCLSMSVSSSISIATHSFSFSTLNTWCSPFCVTLITPPMTVWVCECVCSDCIGVSLTDRFNSHLREPCARCARRRMHVHTQHALAAATPTHHC